MAIGSSLDRQPQYPHGPETTLPTLSGYLRHYAALAPDQVALTFADYATSRHGVLHTLTYAELDARVDAMAAYLQRVATRDDRVAILAPQGLEFIVAFLGSVRAGVVSVPLFSPDLLGHGDRLVGVIADCEPTVIAATAANIGLVREFLTAQPTGLPERVVAVDDLPAEHAPVVPVEVCADEIAYLQYTSGSTREPAGVEISHGNVVADSRAAIYAYEAGFGRTTLVSWLPLFHDMGLVFVTGGCVVGGLHAIVIDPLAFVQRPVRWLEHMAAHPGTVTMAPNFAFDYCAKRIPEAERLKLAMHNVSAMVNGAEPVHAETLQRFYDAFAPAGLKATAVRPSYGLAEATVYVCGQLDDRPGRQTLFDADLLSTGIGKPMEEEGPRTRRLVACGVPIGQHVTVADPATSHQLADGEIGEIWVHGENVAKGYWNKPELSAATFGMTLANPGPDDPHGPWLRTGDLGLLWEGELYVTGRVKDLIIVDGRNHYPQDVEATVEGAHPAIGRHRTAAFSAQLEAGEGVIVVAEISRHAAEDDWDPQGVTRDVRKAVSERHNVSLHDVVLVVPNDVPRTTSGKIARKATLQRYLDGELNLAGASS